jgi:SAM-dependent methyltransferase
MCVSIVPMIISPDPIGVHYPEAMATELKSFDRVAHVYDATRAAPAHVASAVTAALLAAMRPISDAPHLLEVGIGTGRIAVPLATAGVRVTGIDISPGMLGVLRSKGLRIDALFAEAAHPPFRNRSFDAALFVHILHLVPDAEATILATIPLLRPGGALITIRDDHEDDGFHIQAGKLMWDVAEELTGITRPPDLHAEGLETFTRVAAAHGLVVDETIVARYEDPFNARRAMEHMRRRDFSSHWAIPEDRFDDVVAVLERRYEELWGDLDAEHAAQRTVGMTVARPP